MFRLDSNRLLMVGPALFGVGGAGAFLYWITLKAHQSFWQAPGWVALALAAAGILLLPMGVVAHGSDASGGQVQVGGAGSTNLQAGGDIRIRGGQH